MRLSLIAASALTLAACSGGGDAAPEAGNAAAPAGNAAETAAPEPEPETKAQTRSDEERGDLPDYDTERLCRVLGGNRPNAAEIAAECEREEAQAREALAAREPAPRAHREECERLADFSGGSYEFYAACLDASAAAQPRADEAKNGAQAEQ